MCLEINQVLDILLDRPRFQADARRGRRRSVYLDSDGSYYIGDSDGSDADCLIDASHRGTRWTVLELDVTWGSAHDLARLRELRDAIGHLLARLDKTAKLPAALQPIATPVATLGPNVLDAMRRGTDLDAQAQSDINKPDPFDPE